MTVFDRLEAQLIDAHAQRGRRPLPRPAPRRLVAFAAAGAAVTAIVLAGLAGPRASHPPAIRSATTVPAAIRPTSAAGASAGVSVLNATSSPGLAGRIATAFERSGLRIGIVENAPLAAATTRVYFEPGGERTAALVASLLKLDGAARAPVELRRFGSVVVVAGRDRVHGPIITLPRPIITLPR